ncbi:MAG TPA: portal protein, partial [Methylophilaceae bacterium]|nr:portal protein [Methylophilaceae bacterium]
EILERTEVPTDGYIPIVRCVGDEIDVQGKVTFAGIVRDAKDAQRMYNYWRTTEAELVALQPKAPFVMEEGQVEGHEAAWNQANTKSMPYLLYKGTSVAGTPAPPPSRQAMGMAPQGVLEAIQGAAQDMQATTGIRFDATLAERQYDESGKALHELRRSGDVGSFHYIDNFARALKYTGHLLIVMIPKVLDTPRIMNILREDGTEQMIRIDPSAGKAMMMGQNAQGQQLPIFNPSVGKYGVTVTVGPSYATKRIEASEQMADFMAKMPNAAPLIADLYAKVQDWPMAQEIAARLAKTIPPNILMPDPDNMTPEVAAKIQAMMNQIQQMTMERQQLMKQLQDQTADRMILNSKYEKDFAAKMAKIQTDYETKVMDIAQKMETALAKLDHQQRKDVADTTMQIMDRMNTPQETVPATNTGQNPLE